MYETIRDLSVSSEAVPHVRWKDDRDLVSGERNIQWVWRKMKRVVFVCKARGGMLLMVQVR